MKRRKSGYTLIEMIGVMVIMGVVFSALGVSFHIASLSIRGIQATSRRDTQLQRLASHLRTDLHVAKMANVQDGDVDAEEVESSLNIELPDRQTIRYRSTTSGLSREQCDGNEIQQRELYRIDGLESVKWSIDRDRAMPLITLKILRRRGESSAVAPAEVVTIQAALNISPTANFPTLPEGL